MSVEEQRIETILTLRTDSIEGGLNKLEKDVKKISISTEEALAKLNKQSGLYKTLERSSTHLAELQNKINTLKEKDNLTTASVNKELQKSLTRFSVIKQEVRDINKLVNTTPSQLKSQNTELTKIQDKFASLNREAVALQGHYKTIGSKEGLSKLSSQMTEIQKQQQTINTLSKKGLVNLTTTDLKKLDTAKAKYRQLKNQVADTKAELSDIPLSGLTKSIIARSLGYTALFATIAGTTQAIRDGVNYVIEYDASVTKLSVILDVSKGRAEALQSEIVALTQAYGESLQVISAVSLELGRSGIAYEEVAKATETVIKLIKLTGDTADTASKTVVSWLQVFGKDKLGKATDSVESLGGMIAFMANESKLSIDDINTLGTYSLQTAKSLNLTKNVLASVGAALNNNGVASSNLGTSFRRLEKIVNSNSNSMDSFFNSIGINRQKLLLELAEGGKQSDDAFMGLLKTLGSINDQDFLKLLSKVPDVLTKETINQLRNNVIPIMELYQKSLKVTTEELDKADKIAESYEVTFQRLNNNWRELKGDALQPLIGTLADFSQALIDNKDYMKAYIGYLSTFTDTISLGTLGRNFDKELKGYSSSLGILFDTLEEGSTKGFSNKQIKTFKESTEQLIQELKKSLPFVSAESKELGKSILDGLEKGLDELGSEDFLKKSLENKLKDLTKQQKDLKLNLSLEGADTSETEKSLNKVSKEIDKINIALGSVKREAINSLGNITPTTLLDADTVLSLEQTLGKVSKYFKDNSKETVQAVNSVFDSMNERILQGIDEVNNKYSLDINKDNIIGKSSSLLAEITSLSSDLNDLTGAEKKERTKIILDLEEQLKYIDNILKLQGSLNQRETERLDIKSAIQNSNQKELKQQDERTNKTIKQLVAQSKINSKEKEASDLLLAEINTRGENFSLLVSEEAKLKAITDLIKLGLNYEKASTKEAEKKNKARATTEKILQDEAIRVNTLLGYKDKELQSEKALRDLKANPSFLKLSKEEQMGQENVLKNIIEQEKGYKGINKSLIDYNSQIPTLEEGLGSITSTGLQSLENGMINFFDVTSDGFMNMKSMAKGVLTAIYQELIRVLIVKQAVGFLTSASTWSWMGFAEGGELPVTQKANGGYLPNVPTKNFASGGLLSGGSGIRDDLYLGSASGSHVFAMGGEYFTKKDSVNNNTRPMLDYINKTGNVPSISSSGGTTIVSTPTTINIENQTGTPIEANMIEEMMKSNNEDEYEKVINIMLKASNTDSRIRSKFNTK